MSISYDLKWKDWIWSNDFKLWQQILNEFWGKNRVFNKKKIAVNWKHVKEHGHNFLTWAILLSEHSIHVLMCPVFSAIIKYYYSKARRILVRFPKKLGSLFAACDNFGKFSIQTETAYYACSCLWPQDVTAMTSRTINYWFTCIIHLPTDSPK